MSGFSFGTPAAGTGKPAAFSFSQPAAPTTTSAPTAGFSFGTPVTANAGFGATASTPAGSGPAPGNTPTVASLGSTNVFGTPAAGVATPAFATPATAPSTAPTGAFGAIPTSTGTGVAPSNMFNFPSNAPSTTAGIGALSSGLAGANQGLANTLTPSGTPGSGGFGAFGIGATSGANQVGAAAGATVTTGAPTMNPPGTSLFSGNSAGAPGAPGGGFGTAASAQATGQQAAQTLTTCPTGQMTFEDLEKKCNEWKKELELQEESFLKKATQINAWERLVTANSEKITELNEYMKKVKSDQERLDRELDFVVAQQKELEEMLVPLEKQAQAMQTPSIQHHTDVERESTYHSATKVNAQLRGMADTIKDIIEHINASNRSTSDNSSMEQISKILNAHMDALQYIQNGIGTLQEKTEDINKLMGVVRI